MLSDPEQNDPQDDLIIGVVSAANYSALSGSGISCILIQGALEWINSIIYQVH